MKLYRTKNRLIYHEPTFVGKLRTQWDEKSKTNTKPPKQIFMTKKELYKYMSELPAFQQIFYKGRDVFTKKRPMFRGVEIFTY